MLDIKFIRENPETVKSASVNKKDPADVDRILELDQARRQKISEVEKLRKIRNTVSKQIAEFKKEKKDTGDVIKEMKGVSARIKEIDSERSDVEKKLNYLLERVPNIPHESVKHGESENDNSVVYEWGGEREFDFTPINHLDIGTNLGIVDFARGAKIAGSGFPVYMGAGALLERAIISYMLDFHTRRNNYTEVLPPILANRESHFGTGQLPKSEEQMYYIGEDDLFCIPTAEVPVTNLRRDEVLELNDLPLKYCAYTPCFRREAGSWGKDTKGFLRLHQFNKVELVKYTDSESSYRELESLRGNAEDILRSLELKYRVLELCDADLSFASSKCYDLEVWSPAEKKYLEVSSCSNFEDFQARRMNIRYRDKDGKMKYVHTLNGSGVATARLLVAIIETYQTDKGTVKIPRVLQPYMNGMKEILFK